MTMLTVSKLSVGYGEGLVIRSLDLEVSRGETVAVLGRNGMGKSTLLKALIGMLPARNGSILLDGAEQKGRPSYQRVAAGMAYVPQGRLVFPYLTVEENILTGMENSPPKRAGLRIPVLSGAGGDAPPARRQPVRRSATAAGHRARAGQRTEIVAPR